MNQSSIVVGKAKKFGHFSGKSIHFSTFFLKNKRCYVIQNDNWQVYVGYLGDNFQLIRKLIIKQKILCQTYSQQQKLMYVGTNKGIITIIKLQEQKLITNQNEKQEQQEQQKQMQMAGANEEPIIGMIAYTNMEQKRKEIIAIHYNGIISRYANNKCQKSIKLPFKIIKAFTNKNINSINDIAMAIVKQNGKYPYIFSTLHFISLLNSNQSNQQQLIRSIFKGYDQIQNLFPDQQIISEKITEISISNTKPMIGIIQNKKNLTIYRVKSDEKSSHFAIEPVFRVSQQEQMSKLDLLDQNLLYVCPNKGLSTFNIEKRAKVGRGLSFKGSATFEIGCWVDASNRVVLIGTIEGPKSKFNLHELKE